MDIAWPDRHEAADPLALPLRFATFNPVADYYGVRRAHEEGNTMADNPGRPAERGHAPVDPAHDYHDAHPEATEPDVEAAALREVADLALRLRTVLDTMPASAWEEVVGVALCTIHGQLRYLEFRARHRASPAERRA